MVGAETICVARSVKDSNRYLSGSILYSRSYSCHFLKIPIVIMENYHARYSRGSKNQHTSSIPSARYIVTVDVKAIR